MDTVSAQANNFRGNQPISHLQLGLEMPLGDAQLTARSAISLIVGKHSGSAPLDDDW